MMYLIQLGADDVEMKADLAHCVVVGCKVSAGICKNAHALLVVHVQHVCCSIVVAVPGQV